jgi:hypothetical protein
MTIWMNLRPAHRSFRRRGATRAVVLVALLAAVVATAAPASARRVDGGRFHDEYANRISDFCGVPGLTVTQVGTIEGTSLANTHGRDGLEYWRELARIDEVVTDTATHRWVRIVTTSPGKDLHIVDNGNGTLTITSFGTGNSVMYDESGKAIARDPGQFRVQVLIDDGGTPTDPSDDEFLEFLGVLLGSTGRSDDFCAAALEAFGL